jgi:ankyrin repeat protein
MSAMNFLRSAIEADFSVDDLGNTPLHRATMRRNLMLVKLLVEEYGEHPLAPNDEDETPLDVAKEFKFKEIIDYFTQVCNIKPEEAKELDKQQIMSDALFDALKSHLEAKNFDSLRPVIDDANQLGIKLSDDHKTQLKQLLGKTVFAHRHMAAIEALGKFLQC